MSTFGIEEREIPLAAAALRRNFGGVNPALPRRRFLRNSAALATAALAAPRLSPLLHAGEAAPAFRSRWERSPDRPWTGPEFWANPMQDWRVAEGRAECTNEAADRTLHLLTRQLSSRPGNVELRVRIGRAGGGSLSGKGSAGFRIGILGTLKDHPEFHDYRNNLWAPPASGFNAGFTAEGKLFLRRPDHVSAFAIDLARDSVELRLSVAPADGAYAATLTAHDPADGRVLATTKADEITGDTLVGNVALVSNFPTGDAGGNGKAKAKGKAAAGTANLGRFWFSDWRVEGSKLTGGDTQVFGPVLWTQYTLSGGVLKLSAQLPPLGPRDETEAKFEVRDGAAWRTIASAQVHPEARVAVFRVEKWDATRDVPYRVTYALRDRDGGATTHEWGGTIRRDPVDREQLSVADVSCNIHTIFPNVPLVRSMAQLNPDVLAFVGDQFYESTGGHGTQRSPLGPAIIDYLRKWYFHGWTWRELTRDRPSLSLPDDHDVYQGNLWGEGGEGQRTTQEAGGYEMPAAWVNVVHRTQTAHHPDPYDPNPSRRGTLNYYGPMTYGRVSFAILADRQFKSGPEGKVPPTGSNRGDHVKDAAFNPATSDVKGLELLGSKQEQFVREWISDWRGAEMKAVISQTIFSAMATTHGGNQMVLMADYDSNAWAQSPRNRVLRDLRKAFAVHIAGDQHLPAVIRYGIDGHGDGPVAFAGPAVNVGYPRWWEPEKTGRGRRTGNNGLLGDFHDHFGHPMTVLAVKNGPANPPADVMKSVEAKTSGLGVVRFDKTRRTISFECWPYLADVTRPGTQMDTWPVQVAQLENYARKAVAHLPALEIRGAKHPLVEVIDESSGELVYLLRPQSGPFRPHVFAPGRYTVRVSEPESGKTTALKGLEATTDNRQTLQVSL